MKKFLLGIIFIIPVVIVFALTATGTIIKNSAPVNAREISVRDENNVELTVDSVITVNMDETDRYIIVELLPTITAQEIIYELDEDIPDRGEIELEKIENTKNRYRIIPIDGGVCRVIIRAKNNRNIFKAVTVYVREKKLNKLVIYDKEGAAIDKEIELTAPINLRVDAQPITAMKAGSLKWKSLNEDIVKVTENGTIYPIRIFNGSVTVRVSAEDMDGHTVHASVEVNTRNVLVSKTEFYTGEPINEEWVKENALIADRESVTVEDKGEGRYLIIGRDNQQITIEVKAVSEASEWYLEEERRELFLNDVPFLLNPRFKAEERREEGLFPEFSSSDPNVLRVDGKVLVPVSRGKVTIRGEYEGIVKEYEIEVKGKPLFFNLNLNSEDGKLGIKMDRLWARKFFEGEKFVTTYQFGARLRAEEADILWETDNSDWAEIDENALITFKEGSLGKAVKVTATVMAGNYRTTVKREFTFKIHTDDNAVNAYNAEEIYKISANFKGMTTVLQNGVSLSKDYYITSSFFGNGFTLDTANWGSQFKYSKLVTVNNDSLSECELEEVILEDFVVDGGEDSKSFEDNGDGLTVELTTKKVTVKNAIINYTRNSLTIFNTKDVQIEGCILGNSHFTAITSKFDASYKDGQVVFRNIVARESGGPSLFATNAHYSQENIGVSGIPKMIFEGFYDFYNWKNEDEMKNILANMEVSSLNGVSGFGIDPKLVMDYLGKVLQTIFMREDMEHLAYKDAATGKKYFAVGAFFLGTISPVNIDNIVIKDEGIDVMDFTLPNDNKTEEGQLINIISLALKLVNSEMTLFNPNYVITYTNKDNVIRNKPGDPIPENKELFEKLNSFYSSNS